jgi:hypothetical protein
MTAPTDQETVTEREAIALPWGKEMVVQEVAFDSGLKLLRLRIREGKRFTIVDLDARAITRLRALTEDWSDAVEPVDALDQDGG